MRTHVLHLVLSCLVSVVLVMAAIVPLSAIIAGPWSEHYPLITSAADDNDLYIIPHGEGYLATWTSTRDGNKEIYVQDFDATLAPASDARRMTYDAGTDESPVLVTHDDAVWLFWSSDRYGSFDILARTLETGTWGRAEVAVGTPVHERHPGAAVDAGGTLHLAWATDAAGAGDILCSSLGGGEWSAVRSVSSHPAPDAEPVMATSPSGEIWCLWSSLRSGNWDLYAVYGKTFSVPERLPLIAITTPQRYDASPSIAFMDTFVAVAWHDAVRNEGGYARVDADGTVMSLRTLEEKRITDLFVLRGSDGETYLFFTIREDGRDRIGYMRSGIAEAALLTDVRSAVDDAALTDGDRQAAEAMTTELSGLFATGRFSEMPEKATQVRAFLAAAQAPPATTPPPTTNPPTTTPPPTTPPATDDPGVPGSEGGRGSTLVLLVALAGIVVFCVGVAVVRKSRTSPPAPKLTTDESPPEPPVPQHEPVKRTIVQRPPDVITPHDEPAPRVPMPEPRSGAVLIEPSSSKTYPPESEALEEVPFVGYALAPKLRRMGIKDLGSLAKASPQEIAVGTGIPTSLAATIMTNARKMMGWVSEP